MRNRAKIRAKRKNLTLMGKFSKSLDREM